jgi:hypothetical protein
MQLSTEFSKSGRHFSKGDPVGLQAWRRSDDVFQDMTFDRVCCQVTAGIWNTNHNRSFAWALSEENQRILELFL